MRVIEIDQSGRTEYTSTHTVLADSVGNAVVLSAKDKRKLQKLYRSAGKPRVFVLQTFSILLCFLIRMSYHPNARYVIDIEYEGRDAEIKTYLFRVCERLSMSLQKEQVTFRLIGKKSKAHFHAYSVYKKKVTATKTKEILYRKIVRYVL